MSTHRTTKRIDPERLSAAVGRPVTVRAARPEDVDADTTEVEIEANVDQATLDAALAAYVWTEPPRQRNERDLAARLRQRRADLGAIGGGTGVLTSAQRDEAIRTMARYLVDLGRLGLGDLDDDPADPAIAKAR